MLLVGNMLAHTASGALPMNLSRFRGISQLLPCARCLQCRGYADRNQRVKPEKVVSHKDQEMSQNGTTEILDPIRKNLLHIQLLSRSLHRQVFEENGHEKTHDDMLIKNVQDHLKKHKLFGKKTGTLADVDFELPKLLGKNIDEHFRKLGESQVEGHMTRAQCLVDMDVHPPPTEWVFAAGWMRYGKDGSVRSVEYPDEEALVLDVEVLMKEGQFPTMATAVSPTAW